MGIIDFIRTIFTPVTQDQKRLTLISELLQEKVVLRAEVNQVTERLKDTLQRAESWQRKYQEAKSETSTLRKRKSYYKKKCAFLEADVIRLTPAKAVDSAE